MVGPMTSGFPPQKANHALSLTGHLRDLNRSLGLERRLLELHVAVSKLVLLDVDDEDFALGQNMTPGRRRHIGNDDEGILGWRLGDRGDEVVGFGVMGSFGSRQNGEGFAPG